MGPGFHAVVAGAEVFQGGPFGGHHVGFVDGEVGGVGFEQVDEAHVDLADGGGVVGDDAGELEAFALAVEVDFFFEFAF